MSHRHTYEVSKEGKVTKRGAKETTGDMLPFGTEWGEASSFERVYGVADADGK